ncbi:MAG: PD40 domain-containing protein [Flavobacteriales bacterium]|nr:PD40 domain-containing protein [Flavobacteriales bacterium]
MRNAFNIFRVILLLTGSTVFFNVQQLSAQDKVKIENVGTAINSEFAEYHPLISADESVMYFTARRSNTTGGKKDVAFDIFYEDVYVSKRQNGKWLPASNLGLPINTERHDAATGLSPDGQKLFIYREDGNIYQSQLDGKVWTKPEKLNKNINSKYKETAACFSFDGMTMYFISTRRGGLGEKDIYMSKLTDKGDWGPAINLGPTVNSIANEDAVFMHHDGKTLYFSSEGHNSMGGYDIFSSEYNEQKKIWSAPKNLGKPINTLGNDVFFVLAANGKHAYYSSAREEGLGKQDIYRITFLENTQKPELTLIKGKVTDEDGIPLEVDIEVTDAKSNEVIAKTKSNKTSGEYLLSLPSGRDYNMTYADEGYFFHAEHINIPESAPYRELIREIILKKAKVGSSIALDYILFDYNKATLKSESMAGLNSAIAFMRENPMLMFEISGHTDNVGGWEYNMQLSEERAETVVNYFIQHGIDRSTLVHSGYGFEKPIGTNDTETGRQKNRRVEMLVIENTVDKTKISIIFKVQVLASEVPIPITSNRFKGLKDIQQYYHKALYKYAVGAALNLGDAEILKNEMKNDGFNEAFIVAFYDKQRITMRTAKKLTKK